MKAGWFGLLVLAVVCALPARAEAKRGIPMIYNTGQEAFATGPLPPPLDQVEQLKGYQAGYLCDIQGVLWSYFSVSNCKPVAFKDETYTDDREIVQVLTSKYTEADMQRGVWGRFGWMGMAAIVVIGALIALKGLVSGKSSEDDEEEAQANSQKAA